MPVFLLNLLRTREHEVCLQVVPAPSAHGGGVRPGERGNHVQGVRAALLESLFKRNFNFSATEKKDRSGFSSAICYNLALSIASPISVQRPLLNGKFFKIIVN